MKDFIGFGERIYLFLLLILIVESNRPALIYLQYYRRTHPVMVSGARFTIRPAGLLKLFQLISIYIPSIKSPSLIWTSEQVIWPVTLPFTRTLFPSYNIQTTRDLHYYLWRRSTPQTTDQTTQLLSVPNLCSTTQRSTWESSSNFLSCIGCWA